MNKIIAVISLILLMYGCNQEKQQELNKEQMKEDIKYFFNTLHKYHPAPYSKATVMQQNSIKQTLITKINLGLTYAQFIVELGKLNWLLDGHSSIETPFLEVAEKDSNLMPPLVRINSDLCLSLDDTLVTTANTINKINGIKSNILLAMMSKFKGSDPNTTPLYFIERNFSKLLLILNIIPPYRIEFTTKGKDTSITLNGCTGKYYGQIFNTCRESLFNRLPFSFFEEVGCDIYPHSKTAIIYFNTCEPQNKDKFRNKIDSIFKQLKKTNTQYLFLDISRNEGGSSDWGEYLVSKINHKKFKYTHYSLKKVTRTIQKEIQQKVVQILKSDSAKHLSKATLYKLKYCQGLKLQDIMTDTIYKSFSKITAGFNGHVFLLQSRRTFSAGADASHMFKLANIGKILGEKGGSSNPMCVYPYYFTLPNSKLKFKIAKRLSGYATLKNDKLKFIQYPAPDVTFNINPFKIKYYENDLINIISKIKKQHYNQANTNESNQDSTI